MPRSITSEEKQDWLHHGYVLVADFLTGDEVRRVATDVADYYPPWEEFLSRREEFGAVDANAFHWTAFPFKGDALTDVCVSPELLVFAREMLDGSPPFLTHCLLWPKYAGTHDFEQSLHVDYQNNTLVYPRDDGMYRLIPFILYLSDVTSGLGPTWVVSQEVTGTDVDTILTRVLNPEDHPHAIERQAPVVVKAGSLLVYSLRTFHRASRFTDPTGHRFTLNFGYRAAPCLWSGSSPTWPVRGGNEEMIRFLTRATPEQRAAVGFPLPGDAYWNDETLDGVGRRYPDMDMSPYRANQAPV